jgi:hypothetical protein
MAVWVFGRKEVIDIKPFIQIDKIFNMDRLFSMLQRITVQPPQLV